MTDLPHRVVIVSGFLLSAAAYTQLPGPLLTGPFLTIGGWTLAPRPLVACMLPTAALVTYLVLRVVWRRERAVATEIDPSLDATHRSISLVVVMFIAALHVLLVAGLTGPVWMRPWLGRGVVILFGFMLICAGNLLPRTRPNLAFGIRTRLTLADGNAWIHIHRVAGYVAVFIGMSFVIAGAFLTHSTMPLVINIAGILGLIALVRSYRRHARA